MRNLFGDMFDFDHDGELSTFERAMEYEFLDELGRVEEDEEEYTESGVSELTLSGLDPDELEFMDPAERRVVLEDAGLDPDEYDFDF